MESPPIRTDCDRSIPLPGLFLARYRLAVARRYRWGFPCCVAFPCANMPSPLPRRDGWVAVARQPQARRSSPFPKQVDSCITGFEACSAFTRVTACLLAASPYAMLSISCFDGFIAWAVAPIATGWSDQLPGGTCTH